MKPITIIAARSTWLFNLVEMNPKGRRLFPGLTEALTELYDFDDQPEDAPADPSTTAQPGVKFKNGVFETPDGAIRVALELYDDGIVAETAVSTDVTNSFIEHAIKWATTSFDLTFDPQLVRSRIYGSEAVVQFGSRLSEKLKPLGSFAEALSRESFAGSIQHYFPTGMIFTSESGAMPFSIDKRANTPMEGNVFYSKAATDTATHLKLLAEFDRLLAGPSSRSR